MEADTKDKASQPTDTRIEMAEQKGEGSRSNAWFLSPSRLVTMASDSHPVFKWFVVVGGMAALVSTVVKYGSSPSTLVFGVVVLLFIAVVVYVFAQASTLRLKDRQLPALLLIYSALILIVAVATMLFLGAFFNVGLPLRDYLIKSLRPPDSIASAEEADRLGLQLWVGPNANYEQAFKYFTIAADKGYPVAFGQLGWMYELGMVPTGANCVKAMELYRQGYAKGAVNTAWNIGRLYDLGCGVVPDNHLARCWYEKARANGLPEATRDLNAMKEQGRLDSQPCPVL